MAATIREARLDDLDAVIAAVEQAGVTVERSDVVHHLSLIACKGDRAKDAPVDGAAEADALPGVVLCMRAVGDACVLDVVVKAAADQPDLVRELVSKAMAKARSAGVRACRVRVHGELPPEGDPLSTGENWFDRFQREHAA